MDIWRKMLTYISLCYLTLLFNKGIQARNQPEEKFPTVQSTDKSLPDAEVSYDEHDPGQRVQGQRTGWWSSAVRVVPRPLESHLRPDYVLLHAERNSAPSRLLSEMSTLYPFIEATAALDYFNQLDLRRKPKRRPLRILLPGSAGGEKNAARDDRRLKKRDLTEEKVHKNDGSADTLTQTTAKIRDDIDVTHNANKHRAGKKLSWQSRSKSGNRKSKRRGNKGTNFKSANQKHTTNNQTSNDPRSSFHPVTLDESDLIQATMNKTRSVKRKGGNRKSGVGKSRKRKMRPGRHHGDESRTTAVDLASSSIADNIIVLESSERPALQSSESPVVQSSESPVVQCSESPVVQSSESPVVRSSESPVIQSSESPVVQSSESPVVQSSESPVVQSSESHVLHSSESRRKIQNYWQTTLVALTYVTDPSPVKTTGYHFPNKDRPDSIPHFPNKDRPDSIPHFPNKEDAHTSRETSLGNSERLQPIKINDGLIESTTPVPEGDIRLERLFPVNAPSSAPRESTTKYKDVYDFLSNQNVIRRNQQPRKFDAFNQEFAERMCGIFGKRFVPTAIGGKCE